MSMKEHLENLVSEGGKLFVMLCLLLWISVIAVIMHLSGHDPQETGRTLLSNAFTSLFTALLVKLGDKKEPPKGASSGS